MKILHIYKTAPDETTKKIVEAQKAGNQVATIDLSAGSVNYDKLVADVFSHDKVFCW